VRKEFWEAPMEWLDVLAGSLPAPRDDEPPDLRRKIIAELRDHLHAAMQRELLLTGNAEQAQQNVLSRFGEPARLARKLWYDALWEKIMTRRMVLAALVLVVLVSVGSTGLTWILVVQAGQVNQALLEQNRAANELLLAKLAALGNASGNSGKTMEWNSLKVRVSLEKPGGAPAANFKLELEGRLLDTSVPTSLSRTTGPDGIADFGLVRAGEHLLNVMAPWGEAIADSHDYGMISVDGGQIVTVLPGEPQTVEIVGPSKPEETEVTITVDWPNDLAGQSLWLQSPRDLGGHSWKRNDDHAPQYVVVDPAGKMTNPDLRSFGDGPGRRISSIFDEIGDAHVWMEEEQRYFVGRSRSYVDAPGIYQYFPRDTGYSYGDYVPAHIWLSKTAAVSRLKWPSGTYSVAHLAVGGESETDEKSLPDDVLHPIFLGGITFRSEDSGGVRLLYPDKQRAQAVRRKRGIAKTEIPRFESVAGRVNEWRLSLPQSLVELLKEPPIKPETDERDLNVLPSASAYSDDNAPAPRPARRAKTRTEDDPPVDGEDLPLRPQFEEPE
jgi:hypothetical protein